MKKLFLSFLLFSGSASADAILNVGQSISINGQTVACVGAPPVVGKSYLCHCAQNGWEGPIEVIVPEGQQANNRAQIECKKKYPKTYDTACNPM